MSYFFPLQQHQANFTVLFISKFWRFFTDIDNILFLKTNIFFSFHFLIYGMIKKGKFKNLSVKTLISVNKLKQKFWTWDYPTLRFLFWKYVLNHVYQTFFKKKKRIFNRRKKPIQVWSSLRVSKWWRTFHFWVWTITLIRRKLIA